MGRELQEGGAGEDGGSRERSPRDLIREHLVRVIALLSGFLVASIAVVFSDAPLWSKGLAAAIALVGLSLVALWLTTR